MCRTCVWRGKHLAPFRGQAKAVAATSATEDEAEGKPQLGDRPESGHPAIPSPPRGCRLWGPGCQALSSLLGMAAGAVGDVVQGPHGGGPLPPPRAPPDPGP
ncbi:unnamed protein product [Rangifer tarandus platyrhynchus]|uniref:Uncharacterized protein n=1 Tax=Rangifer tarandus platyrhynchus TaxID=3082113 RepID=A0ABN8YQQ0_RANTA|nr:unnamed protein product [Rangifer tarandus platyrhynchus]